MIFNEYKYMEFFSNSKPDLVNPIVRKSVFKIMKSDTSNTTISDKISSILTSFYTDFISENKTAFSIIVIMTVFLLYRYYNKKKLSKNKQSTEQFSVDEQQIINNIMNEQTEHLKLDSQPSFNNLESVNKQHEDINYPPEPIPMNIPDKGIVLTKSISPYPPQFENLNNPEYDYDDVYKNKSRSYYSGTHNPYENAQDTDIVNPMGWSNRFNSDTGAFITNMTNTNKQNINDYQTILDNMEGNLIQGLKLGPANLNNIPEFDPPYSDNV
jgi:hypothetical protein